MDLHQLSVISDEFLISSQQTETPIRGRMGIVESLQKTTSNKKLNEAIEEVDEPVQHQTDGTLRDDFLNIEVPLSGTESETRHH